MQRELTIISISNLRNSISISIVQIFRLDEDNYTGVVPLIGHCIATWYAAFRYLVKLTELETSWGRGDTVTY